MLYGVRLSGGDRTGDFRRQLSPLERRRPAMRVEVSCPRRVQSKNEYAPESTPHDQREGRDSRFGRQKGWVGRPAPQSHCPFPQNVLILIKRLYEFVAELREDSYSLLMALFLNSEFRFDEIDFKV